MITNAVGDTERVLSSHRERCRVEHQDVMLLGHSGLRTATRSRLTALPRGTAYIRRTFCPLADRRGLDVKNETDLLAHICQAEFQAPPRIVLLSDGFAGKSEWTRQLVHELSCRPELAHLVPWRIELGALRHLRDETEDALVDWLVQQGGLLRKLNRGSTTVFSGVANERLVLILDGLDEVRLDWSAFADVLRSALSAEGRLGNCRVILAGRLTAETQAIVPQERNVLTVRLNPIDRRSASVFVEAVSSGLAGLTAPKRALDATVGNGDLVHQWPLLLTCACLTAATARRSDATITATATPSGVLNSAINAVLRARAPSGADANFVHKSRRTLTRLALQATPPWRPVSFDVARQLASPALLDTLSRTSGILVGDPVHGYEFSAKWLAEYLLGTAIAGLPEETIRALFGAQVWDTAWEETLYWAMAELSNAAEADEKALLPVQLLEWLNKAENDVLCTARHRLLRFVSTLPGAVVEQHRGRVAQLFSWAHPHPAVDDLLIKDYDESYPEHYDPLSGASTTGVFASVRRVTFHQYRLSQLPGHTRTLVAAPWEALHAKATRVCAASRADRDGYPSHQAAYHARLAAEDVFYCLGGETALERGRVENVEKGGPLWEDAFERRTGGARDYLHHWFDERIVMAALEEDVRRNLSRNDIEGAAVACGRIGELLFMRVGDDEVRRRLKDPGLLSRWSGADKTLGYWSTHESNLTLDEHILELCDEPVANRPLEVPEQFRTKVMALQMWLYNISQEEIAEHLYKEQLTLDKRNRGTISKWIREARAWVCQQRRVTMRWVTRRDVRAAALMRATQDRNEVLERLRRTSRDKGTIESGIARVKKWLTLCDVPREKPLKREVRMDPTHIENLKENLKDNPKRTWASE